MYISPGKYLVLILALTAFFAFLGCKKPAHPPDSLHPEHTQEHETHEEGRYTVLGQTYTPLATSEGFVEEGVASWYGPKFHGQETASGEVFNMYQKTAAHRILPLGTKVRVTNLDNDKSIKLEINDRGPFIDDRVIDLSFAAAEELDMIGPGTAPVRVEALENASVDGLPEAFYIQVGSFTDEENARIKKAEMQNLGYRDTRVQKSKRQDQEVWRVQVGAFRNLAAAHKAKQRFAERYNGAFIVAD